jgi:hypothetical protein
MVKTYFYEAFSFLYYFEYSELEVYGSRVKIVYSELSFCEDPYMPTIIHQTEQLAEN